MSDQRKPDDAEDQVEDLDVAESEAEDVKGGRKKGENQQEYLKVTLEEAFISS